MVSTDRPPGHAAAASHRPSEPRRVALWAASQGWHVFPLRPGTKIAARACDECSPSAPATYQAHDPETCPCPSLGRHCHGLYAATTDTAVIGTWWDENSQYNVGVHAGRSGLLILDLDRHRDKDRPADPAGYLPGVQLPVGLDPAAVLADGVDVLNLLADLRGQASPLTGPQTLTVATPSGGIHLWYRIPEGTSWGRAVGELGWQIDALGGLSVAIMPGTATDKGIYTATGTCRIPAPLPAWLAAELERIGVREDNRPQLPTRRPGPAAAAFARVDYTARQAGYLEAAVRGELESVVAAQGGGWNLAIFKAACKLGELVAGGYLDEHAVEDELLAAAAPNTGADHRAATATIRSGLRTGAKSPRRLELGT